VGDDEANATAAVLLEEETKERRNNLGSVPRKFLAFLGRQIAIVVGFDDALFYRDGNCLWFLIELFLRSRREQ
jgi:hypothetical protein